MLPITIQRPPLRAGTGAIPSLVGRGLQFPDLNQMKTQTGSPFETQADAELPRMERREGPPACLLGAAASFRSWWLLGVPLRAQSVGSVAE